MEPITDTSLTLPGLVDALRELLAEGYAGTRSGRVRDLPDARTIRWYQTLGLVDRPAHFRGRTALFGRRHLLQLSAIKKLQAADFPLADVQRGLAGKNDAELARCAGLSLKQVDQQLKKIAAVIATRRDNVLAAALSAGPPDIASDTAPEREPGAFWKARPAEPQLASTASPPAPLPVASAAADLQSEPVGPGVMLLWTGRKLSAVEQERLKSLSAPLVVFLASCTPGTQVSGSKASGNKVPADRPTKPKGVRR
jgi:DNA-binding transcriptional MerR regulator